THCLVLLTNLFGKRGVGALTRSMWTNGLGRPPLWMSSIHLRDVVRPVSQDRDGHRCDQDNKAGDQRDPRRLEELVSTDADQQSERDMWRLNANSQKAEGRLRQDRLREID